MPTTYKLIWTKRAVERFDRSGSCDPRHTISAYPVDLSSPWFRSDLDRKLKYSPWLLLDCDGAVVARRDA